MGRGDDVRAWRDDFHAAAKFTLHTVVVRGGGMTDKRNGNDRSVFSIVFEFLLTANRQPPTANRFSYIDKGVSPSSSVRCSFGVSPAPQSFAWWTTR